MAFNIWPQLRRINKTEEKSILSSGGPLPSRYVTDGMGNIFEYPNHGRTPLFTTSDKPSYKDVHYAYNWDNKEIEIYVYNDKDSTDVNSYDFVTSYSVSPENFIDGPDYWAHMAHEEMEDEVNSALADFKIKEAYELYGEIIDEDKLDYKYLIKLEIDTENCEDAVQDKYKGDWNAFTDDVIRMLTDYSVESELYTQKLKVTASFSDLDEVILVVNFSMPLTKEELLDVYNDYIESKKDIINGYGVVINIEDIIED